MNQLDDTSMLVQADLRYLATLSAGQLVALVNLGGHLRSALQKDGLEVFSAPSTGALTVPSALDCIFIASLAPGSLDSVLSACAKLLKPGGQVVLCIPNTRSPKRLNYSRSRKFSLHQARAALQKTGLLLEATYGIHNNLDEPRFFVPLENHQVATYFLEQILTPYTRALWLGQLFAPLLIKLGWQDALFTYLCLVAHTPSDE
jgi:hypothetical protein